MNGYNRLLSTLKKSEVDSLAYAPITMMLAADVIDVPYGEYAADYRVLVKGQLETARLFGFDHVSAISDPAREAADHGATICFSDDAPPAIDESNALLSDKAKLKTLSLLDPLKEGGRCFDRIMAIGEFAKMIKGELFIEGWIEGPCAEAADLRGINHLMLDFHDDPDFVRQLFEFNIRSAIRFAEEQIKAGADIIGIGDAAASLVGPKIYREFVLPYEKQLIDAIHDLGSRVRLHICGNISRSLNDIGTLECDFIDIDSMVSLESARKEMGDAQVFAGNIDPVKMLRNGTPDAIYRAVAECHKQAGVNFIVGAGCEIPRDTPHENINAMLQYARNVCR
ncbi:MAG: uroporphyrinogen decarboxylase family protein [Thermoguttaceae bacterium]